MLDVDSQWEFLVLTNMLTFIYCINGATKFYLGALSMLERSDIILMAVIVGLCSLLVTFFLVRDLGLYSLVLATFNANIMFFFIARAFSNFYMKQLASKI